MFNSNASSASGGANYIEDVFSTWLYTGTGATQTITNGLDLSTKGGATWIKSRSAATNNCFFDTVRGATKYLNTNAASQQATDANGLTAFGTTGFTLGSGNTAGDQVNTSAATFGSWSFAKQTKFFDIVTWTGNGTVRTIPHSLGSVPGCIMVKSYSSSSYGSTDWVTYHRSLGATQAIKLNTTAAASTSSAFWNDTSPTSTVFTLGTDSDVNGASDTTYIAYIFAHDAGGFGLTGTDNVISCGSYTCVAYPGDVTVSLGYEPQYVMVKNATQASNWVIYDNMRGMPATNPPNPVTLAPDSSAAENGVTGSAPGISPTATGFIARAGLTAVSGSAGDKIIYIAIRRGPMKVPTDGTKVFVPISRTGTGAAATITGASFPPDMVFGIKRTDAIGGTPVTTSRLQGALNYLTMTTANAEATLANTVTSFNMNGISVGTSTAVNGSGYTHINWLMGRAPSVFDVVCYTGAGSTPVIVNHNLAAVPEFIIVKQRGAAGAWYSTHIGLPNPNQNVVVVDGTNATIDIGANFYWNRTTTTYTDSAALAAPGATFVAYLFATCPGVSKVGYYTGTGTTKQVDCGFTAGSRFVLIKRIDSSGDWYVWDSARGIVAGNDPYILLNTTAAEVTSTDYVDTYAAGFELSSTAPAALNASGGSYIFLAFA